MKSMLPVSHILDVLSLLYKNHCNMVAFTTFATICLQNSEYMESELVTFLKQAYTIFQVSLQSG